LSSYGNSVRGKSAVASVEPGEKLAGEFPESELTEGRDIYAVGVGDRDWSDFALLFARPALPEASELSSLELVFAWIEKLAIEENEVNASDRSLSESDTTAQSRVGEAVVSL
jgi:hypothetical protein